MEEGGLARSPHAEVPVCVKSEKQDDTYMMGTTERQPFSCITSGEESAEIDAFNVHARSQADEKPYWCATCGAVFALNQTAIHSGGTIDQCPVCDTKITKTSPLRRDSIKLNNVDARLTDEQLHENSLDSVSDYMHVKHEKQDSNDGAGEEPVGNVEDVPVKLEDGDRTVTIENKPYQCVTCAEEFINLHTCRLHVQCHTNEKPCQCTCGALLADQHIRHTGEKANQCHICGAETRKNLHSNTKLGRHVNVSVDFRKTSEEHHENVHTASPDNMNEEQNLSVMAGTQPLQNVQGLFLSVKEEKTVMTLTSDQGVRPYQWTAIGEKFPSTDTFIIHANTCSGEKSDIGASESDGEESVLCAGEKPVLGTTCRDQPSDTCSLKSDVSGHKDSGVIEGQLLNKNMENDLSDSVKSEDGDITTPIEVKPHQYTSDEGRSVSTDTVTAHTGIEAGEKMVTGIIYTGGLPVPQNGSVQSYVYITNPITDVSYLCTSEKTVLESRGENSLCQTTGGERFVKASEKNNINAIVEKPYQCTVCSAAFPLATSLKRHMGVHTGERPFQCQVCGVGFTRKGNLTTHMRLHTGQTPHKCAICGTGFTTSSCLKSHMMIHSGEKPHKCDICGASFALSGTLKEHMTCHSDDKLFKCPTCEKGFRSNNALQKHARSHTGAKPYKCTVCGSRFTLNFGLTLHMRSHTGERPYQCKICDASFARSGNLSTHMRTHTGEKPHICDVCEVGFATRGSLKSHSLTHTGEKPWQCTICGASFKLNGALKVHMRSHTGEKPFQCGTCDKAFGDNDSLKKHTRTHTGEKPYVCTVCGACFALSCTMRIHMRTHTGEKPYQCKTCSAKFSSSSALTKHMVSHSNEKPHKCTTCGSRFARKSNLRAHMRTHTADRQHRCTLCIAQFSRSYQLKEHMRTHDEKPFQCTTCGAEFKQNSNLKAHRRTHTGEKPYTCTVCGAGFPVGYSLQRHLKTHTGEKPFNCSTCGAGFSQSGNLKSHERTHTGERPYICTVCDAAFTQVNHLKSHIHRAHKDESPPSGQFNQHIQ